MMRLEQTTLDFVLSPSGTTLYFRDIAIGIGMVAIGAILIEKVFAVRTEVLIAEDRLSVHDMFTRLLNEHFGSVTSTAKRLRSFEELLQDAKRDGLRISKRSAALLTEIDEKTAALASTDLQSQFHDLAGFTATIERLANEKLELVEKAHESLNELEKVNQRLDSVTEKVTAAERQHAALLAQNPDVVPIKRT